jgi:hypothetical protein
MDGKRRILIVSFLDCTQVSSRKKHGKAGRIQEASKEQRFLMVVCLEACEECHPPKIVRLPCYLIFYALFWMQPG